MKKLLTILVMLILSVTLQGQIYIDLSNMTETIHLGDNDCSGERTQYITTGDVNMNNHKIELEYATLDVMGDINGPGKIHGHHGCDDSAVYVQGTTNTFEHVHPHLAGYIEVQDNVEITDEPNSTGGPLNTNNYLLKEDYNYNKVTKLLTFKQPRHVQVYNILGQVFIDRTSDSIDLSQLNDIIVLVQTDIGSVKLLR